MFDFKLDEKVVETAALAPKVFVEASLGEGGEYKREPGIQLTKEQILSLRRYELLGLSLPYRTNDVAAYLNYGPGEVGQPGLTVMDFFTTFSAVYNHARLWSPLREKIQLTGVHLKTFAGTMIEYGDGIFEVYEELKSSGYLEKHDITTVEEYLQLQNELPDLPDLTLAPSDVPDIKYFLNVMLEEVRLCHAKAEEVRQGLDSFGADMRERILPQIKLRLLAVTGNSYEEDVLGIQNDIDQRADELDDLNKQYHQMVRESIESAAGLNFGGLIMSIYVGVEAEKLRTQYNELKTAQDMDNRQLASKSQTLNSLNRVRGHLQVLSAVTIEAEVATQNLMLVWNALSQFLTDSVRALDQVRDAVRLRHFIRHLKLVVSPWKQNIEPSSRALLKVFEEAQKEIDTSHSSQGRTL
ncbi:alpha-xenorhabdolysin family binary toxin subunit A [Pseudomonas sp. R3-56]|uniref:alpha-xenorhabdolysin family binary toxin subunit A n=1 Tax=Pseudomonas sp. R3-56 TaxID=2817401 RepID=UPI003DA8882E